MSSGIIQPPLAVLIGGGQPSGADDCQQHCAVTHCLGNDLGEVGPQRDRVDVHEDLGVDRNGPRAGRTVGQ